MDAKKRCYAGVRLTNSEKKIIQMSINRESQHLCDKRVYLSLLRVQSKNPRFPALRQFSFSRLGRGSAGGAFHLRLVVLLWRTHSSSVNVLRKQKGLMFNSEFQVIQTEYSSAKNFPATLVSLTLMPTPGHSTKPAGTGTQAQAHRQTVTKTRDEPSRHATKDRRNRAKDAESLEAARFWNTERSGNLWHDIYPSGHTVWKHATTVAWRDGSSRVLVTVCACVPVPAGFAECPGVGSWH